MKQLSDGYSVPDRIWYYLLDWNDTDNFQYIRKTFNKDKLRSLTKAEFITLFQHATECDKALL